MAKQGLKKRADENARRLQLLGIAIAVANVLHLAVRFGLRWSTLVRGDWLGLALTSAVYYFCAGTVWKAAKPSHSSTGELIDGGSALDQGGLLGYYQDLTYMCILVQLASLVTRRAWLVFITVPAYGTYLLWKHVLQPYLNQPKEKAAPRESALDRKRREKSERKQQPRAVYKR